MTDLERLGYQIDDQGVLRKGAEPFKFTTQEDYEELGEAVTQEVYRLLEERCHLIRSALQPSESKKCEEEDVSFVFHSKDHHTADTLLVLIHGSGVVRAGQWARSLIINHNLECGTQIPFIEKAHENGWSVVVFNTNDNGTSQQLKKYSETPSNHAINAWNFFVEKTKAKKIFVVAHSRGGYDLMKVLGKFGKDERIESVCVTDGWFEPPRQCRIRTNPLFSFIFSAGGTVNDYKIEKYDNEHAQQLWAGHNKHEWTSHAAIRAIFYIFEHGITMNSFEEVAKRAKQLVLPENLPQEDSEESGFDSSVEKVQEQVERSSEPEDNAEVSVEQEGETPPKRMKEE